MRLSKPVLLGTTRAGENPGPGWPANKQSGNVCLVLLIVILIVLFIVLIVLLVLLVL